MLTLTRRQGERFHVGEDVVVEVVGIGKHRVRLGIRAPRHVPIVRGELRERIEREQRAAGRMESREVSGGAPAAAWSQPEGLAAITVPASPPILHFERGVYGFGGSRHFVLCELGDGSGLLALVDLEDAMIQLTVAPAERVRADYPVQAAIEVAGATEEPVAVLLVVTRPADGRPWTVNLAAPIVVGLHTRKGVQVILDGGERPMPMRAPFEEDVARAREGSG